MTLEVERTEQEDGSIRWLVRGCPEGPVRVALDSCIQCGSFRGLEIDSGLGAACVRCSIDNDDERVAPSKTAIELVMSAPVLGVERGTSLTAVRTILLERNISAVVVLATDGTPVGLVSKTDLLAAGRDLETRDAASAMTERVIALPGNAPVALAAALMAHEHIHRLVVVNDEGVAVGVVSTIDILRWLAQSEGYVVTR